MNGGGTDEPQRDVHYNINRGYFRWCDYLCSSPNNFQLTLLGNRKNKQLLFIGLKMFWEKYTLLKLLEKFDCIGPGHSHLSRRVSVIPVGQESSPYRKVQTASPHLPQRAVQRQEMVWEGFSGSLRAPAQGKDWGLSWPLSSTWRRGIFPAQRAPHSEGTQDRYNKPERDCALPAH